MKSDIEKQIVYFSAYPLKALNLPEEEYQSSLRVPAKDAKSSPIRIRVLPMANPYREKDFEQAKENATATK